MDDLPAITLRPAREGDLPTIVALFADDVLGAGREAPGEETDAKYRRAFADIEAQAGNTVFIAELDGEMAGCFQFTVIPNLTLTGTKRAQIEGVRVASRFRGKRIGEAMFRAAIEFAREEGCGLVQLTSNKSRKRALLFYENLGFEPSHIGFKLYLDR